MAEKKSVQETSGESEDTRNTRAVRALIASGGDVNAVDESGNTALHVAARNGNSAVVKLLLNLSTERDEQILSQLAVKQVTADVCEPLQHPLINTVDVDQTSNQIAAQGDNLEIANDSVSSTVNAVVKGQATPHEKIDVKIMCNGANINACNNAKMTPLHLACQNGHTSIVEILLDNHATVDVTEQSEETPFYLAAKNGHADIADLLLRRGVCDFVLSHFTCDTPLHVAVEKCHTEVVEVILKHSRRIYEKSKRNGNEPRKKIQERGFVPVEIMKSDGRLVSVEIVWAERNIPLWLRRNSIGRLPLDLAASKIDLKLVQLLLNLDQQSYSEYDMARSFRCLILAIFHRDFIGKDLSDAINCRMKIREIAQLLINSRKLFGNHQHCNLKTILHTVTGIFYEHMPTGSLLSTGRNMLRLRIEIICDAIQLLLENGANFNVTNGETPLIIASRKGYYDAIQVLFDWEAKSGLKLDIDARDQCGATALIKAAEGHHVSVVRLLLSHKASVNLVDYRGFTALHAAIYEPNTKWFDWKFFSMGLCHRKVDGASNPDTSHKTALFWRYKILNPFTDIGQIQNCLECKKDTDLCKEKVVKLLLDNDETDVNAVDFRRNTPLDLAVKSSMRITSATFDALQNCGAIRNLESEEDGSFEATGVDERGRNPLHRLMIIPCLHYKFDVKNLIESPILINEIALRQHNFRQLATVNDDKGRTPLHYAVMQPFISEKDQNQLLHVVRVLLKLGSKVDATDVYGKTPLHYAEMDETYKVLVHYGANEDTKDNHGHTAKHLIQLRERVKINEINAKNVPIGRKALYVPKEFVQVGLLNTKHVTELTRHRSVEALRLHSQSPRPDESSEEVIWKIWTQSDFIRLNRRLSQLKPLVQNFIQRLADGIKQKDWRFECQPTLVGSSDEETQTVISADFDFNFKLVKIMQLCEAFPHPLGTKGYFQLRRKPTENAKRSSDEKFDCFFNLDQCLLTNELNSRFQMLAEDVLKDLKFWQNEHLFEFDLKRPNQYGRVFLCKTLKLSMIHSIADGDGDFLFVKISIDVVACVHVEDCWSEVFINPSMRSSGSVMVFDVRVLEPPEGYIGMPSRPTVFSETVARISFAPFESRIIKDSPLLLKAAYVVCKMILYSHHKSTYQLKNCLLYCMEVFNARNISETTNEDEFTPRQLAFWVERIMFCFVKFYRHGVYPCYFMPSFMRRFERINNEASFTKIDDEKKTYVSFNYLPVYGIYLDLCPDDATIDVPVFPVVDIEEMYNTYYDPNWKKFDRKDFIKELSSRSAN